MGDCLNALIFLLLTLVTGADSKVSVARLEARYRPAKTLQASFLERYTENGRLIRMEAGTAYFKRPGRMRWEYEAPEKNLFLVDGKTAWFYVPADHSVTRVPASQSADWRTPLAFLADGIKVSRVCGQIVDAIDEKPENPEHAMLYCELRGAAASKREKSAPGELPSQKPANGEAVFFEVDRNTGDLVRVLVRDPGGIGIEFCFANWRIDSPVSDSLFHFEVPKGVAIVNGELPAGDFPVKR
jgi:outer membrane lipoprotein carrier protein